MSDLSIGALFRRAILFAVLAIAAYAAGIVFIIQSASLGAALGLSTPELMLVASAGLSLLPHVAGDVTTTPPPGWRSRLIVWVVMLAAYGFFLNAQGLVGVAAFAAGLVFWANLIKATERILPLAATAAELKRRELQRDDTSGAPSA